MKGTIVEIDGRITGLACGAGQRDLELDVWQANDEGRYDNDHVRLKARFDFVLREL